MYPRIQRTAEVRCCRTECSERPCAYYRDDSPKVAISDYMGIVKGRTAIRVFNKFRRLKKRPYWGNHFWARGYCVDTVGLDAEKIRLYVKYQEEKERRAERGQLRLF